MSVYKMYSGSQIVRRAETRLIEQQYRVLLSDIARLERLGAPQSVLRSLYMAKRRIQQELDRRRLSYTSL